MTEEELDDRECGLSWVAACEPLEIDEDAEEELEPTPEDEWAAYYNWLMATPEQRAIWDHLDAVVRRIAEDVAKGQATGHTPASSNCESSP